MLPTPEAQRLALKTLLTAPPDDADTLLEQLAAAKIEESAVRDVVQAARELSDVGYAFTVPNLALALRRAEPERFDSARLRAALDLVNDLVGLRSHAAEQEPDADAREMVAAMMHSGERRLIEGMMAQPWTFKDDERLERLFDLVHSMAVDDWPLNIVVLLDEAVRRGEIDELGGFPYLKEIFLHGGRCFTVQNLLEPLVTDGRPGLIQKMGVSIQDGEFADVRAARVFRAIVTAAPLDKKFTHTRVVETILALPDHEELVPVLKELGMRLPRAWRPK